MKWKLLTIAAVFSIGLLQAQPSYNSPDPFNSAASFADYVSKKFSSDHDRFTYLYNWICNNIQYNKDSALYFNWSAPYDIKIEATLRRKKGVCENYASLLADIAGRMNIPTYVVHGFPAAKTGAGDDSHAWVAVQLNNQWWLCDPTWDAMSIAKTKYFLVAPATFIETHIPFDPMWQLLERPHYFLPGNKETFNFRDSIATFLQLDSLQQLQASQRRIRQSNTKNNMVRNWESLNNMNIAIIAGEKDEQHYNSAVKTFNEALQLYNVFIQYRNAQFQPAVSDDVLEKMLLPITALLQESKKHIKLLGSIRENFQYDPGDLLQRIHQLESNSSQQQKFIKAFTAADAKERARLLETHP